MSKLYYRSKLITAPAAEPLLISDFTGNDEFMKSLYYSTSTQNYLTDYLIPTARQRMESHLNRKFITQTWELSFDCLPAEINIPFGELQSISSIKILAVDGTETIQDSSKYDVLTGDNGMVVKKTTASWSTTSRQRDLMRIRFVCGYGDVGTDVPETIKLGILNYVRYLYYHPQENIPSEIIKSIAEYKIWRA